MTSSATIKIFLPFGDPKKVRTAEISNWTGKALAAPRIDLDLFLQRQELSKPGVYLLLGVDSSDGSPLAYIGEAEDVGERLKQHKVKDYWNSIIVFVSKDENLTRAHIRYLEGRIIDAAKTVGRYKIANSNGSGAHLPESDLHDMEVFLDRITQLLPVLGSEILTPLVKPKEPGQKLSTLTCAIKGAVARGERSPNGFVVFKGSKAVLEDRPSAKTQGAWTVALREKLKGDGSLVQDGDYLVFTKDIEFASPSAAAAVVYGGTAQGPSAWKDSNGKTLKELDEMG
jgi:hypothetical protein